MTERSPQPGRRPGNPDTRETILRSARELFADQGFASVTVRQIAAHASVDPALIHHYFDTKERLFLEAVQFPIDPSMLLSQIFRGDLAGFPERLVRTFISVWDDPVTGQAMRSLIRRAASDPQTGRLVKDFFTTQIVATVRDVTSEIIDPDELPVRASLVASQLLGLALVRYVLEFDPLHTASPESLIAAIAPTIARYLFDADLPLPTDDPPARDTTH